MNEIVKTQLQSIAGDVENYVQYLFNIHYNSILLYHNFTHTRNVVKRAIEIAEAQQADEAETFVVQIASWFHDTGQLTGPPSGHEQRSVDLMSAFQPFHQVPEQLLMRIQKCIMATKLPTVPVTLEEKIICDADLYHLGTSDFIKANENVRKEIELRLQMPQPCWDRNSLEFLKKHTFFTPYCQHKLSAGLEQNILALEKKVNNHVNQYF